MSNKLKENYPVIQLLSKIKNNSERKKLLNQFDGDEDMYNSIGEILRNYNNGNIKLSKSQSNKLNKHKKIFNAFCCAKNKVSEK
jgi:hypothetical protein